MERLVSIQTNQIGIQFFSSALETGKLTLSIPGLQQHNTSSHELSWKLNCTIWAHVDNLHKKSCGKTEGEKDHFVKVRSV